MLRPLAILFLLAAVIVSAGCQTSTELDPSQFLPMLRQESEPFNEFYGNEIEPLHAEIHWFFNPNQTLTLANTVVSSDSKSARITLSHIPTPDEGNASLEKESFIIAHELASLVIAPKLQKGWDIQCGNAGLGFQVFDMIRTPLRDHILAEYGFDVDSNYQWYLQREIISSPCIMRTDPLSVHWAACRYVWHALYWQYVLGNHGVAPELASFCQRCAPNIQEEGLDILNMINGIGGIGNITSDNAKALYGQLINKYSLDCHIVPFS